MADFVPERLGVSLKLPVELRAEVEAHGEAGRPRLGERRPNGVVGARAIVRAGMLVIEDRGRQRAVLSDQRPRGAVGCDRDGLDAMFGVEARQALPE